MDGWMMARTLTVNIRADRTNTADAYLSPIYYKARA